jgi:hypothetical protein
MTVASAIPKSDTAPSCFSFQSSNMSQVPKVWLNRFSVRFNTATIYSSVSFVSKQFRPQVLGVHGSTYVTCAT